MVAVTNDALIKAMKEKGREVQVQEETGQILEILKIGEREFPLFIRIMDGNSLVQLLSFFPVTVQEKTIPDLARLLHLLNKELDIPGFGLDETASVAFYRCMIPVVDGEIPDTVFHGFLNSVQIVCETFSPAVEAVAGAHATFEELLKKAEEEKKRVEAEQKSKADGK